MADYNRLKYYLLIAVLSVFSLLSVHAAETAIRTIRVGFFEYDGFHHIDQNGIKSGYGYDFLTLMRRYADVSYEYIGYDKSMTETMQLLLDGEIDMYCSAHKTPERELLFDFSLPIGTSDVRLNVRVDDNRFDGGDDQDLNGITIGMIEGTSTCQKMQRYAQENGFTFHAQYFTTNQRMEAALQARQLDAVATSSLRKTSHEKTIAEFNTQSFYAVVRKGNTELLSIINAAIQQMNASEGNWKAKLYYDNYERFNHSNLSFTPEEQDYIAAHSQGGKKIVIAFDNKWSPFTYRQEGEYVGILPDYWQAIVRMTGMEYTTYSSDNDIIDEKDLLEGKADIYLGYCFNASKSETNGFVESAPIMDLNACFLTLKGATDPQKIGVSRINPRLNSLLNLVRGQQIIEYPSSMEALDALKDGQVDELFLYDYEGEMMVNQDHSGTLRCVIAPNISLSICAITPETESHLLVGIVTKCIHNLSASEVNTIVARNLSFDTDDLTLMDNIILHPVFFSLIGLVLFVLLIALVFIFIHNRIRQLHEKELEDKVEEISTLNAEMERSLQFISSMSKIYFAFYHLNIDTKQVTEIKTTDKIKNVVSTSIGLDSAIELLYTKLVMPEFSEPMKAFLDIRTLDQRLAEKDYITLKYIGVNTGWSQAFLIAANRDADGKIHTVIFAARTIHREKELEEKHLQELQKAVNEATEANAAKTSFLFNMSHDIRTPMNAIIGLTNLLRKHQDDPVKRNDYLGKIENSSAVLLSIINNVLEMARIEKGTVRVEENVIDLNHLSQSIHDIAYDHFLKKDIEISTEYTVQHHFYYGDETKLREVFMNIISNAYKYTPEGGKISVKLEELPFTESSSLYRTTITDTGIGMSQEFLPHLFEEFTRENNTTQNKIEGTGLGMPIVKCLVELMGGTIEVQSQQGVGTTFVVIIPHRFAEPPSQVEHTDVVSDTKHFDGKRILLAEDNDLNAEIAIEILSEAGFVIDRSEDGARCVEMLQAAPGHYYSAILMDIQMPQMNGYETTRAIRQLSDLTKANIPILAMTANAFEEDKREAKRAGMNGHLAKPINVSELMRKLARVIK